MSCYCDYEIPRFYTEGDRKARKLHCCGECGRAILPGETYRYGSGLWDGSFALNKRCSHCHSLAEWLKAHVPCFCDLWGDFYSQASDTVDEYSHHTTGLFVGFHRRRLRIRQMPRYAAVKAAQPLPPPPKDQGLL